MANVLFCWELGAGFGHLTPHREVLAKLREKGHMVHVAVRDLARASKAFEGLAFGYWQAPTPQNRPESKFQPTINFTQILHNTGLSDSTGLAARIAAWRSIIAATRPHVALVDYCPAALLALRGKGIATVVTGTGFLIPPNVTPFPVFPMLANLAKPENLEKEEKQMVAAVNAALSRHRIPPVNSVAQIYHDVSAKIFRALPDFDHYANRGPAEFLGLPPDPQRAHTTWPPGDGPKVFAYLKPFQMLETLLTEIQQRGITAIIACDGIPKVMRDKFKSEKMAFVAPTIDVAQMGRESTFAITNGNFTTTVRLLLQGCPVLTVPLQLEQQLLSDTVRRLGVGLVARPTVAEDFPMQLTEMTKQVKYRNMSRMLALKYKGRPDDYVDRAVAVLERLLPPVAGGAAPAAPQAAAAAPTA